VLVDARQPLRDVLLNSLRRAEVMT
jgi:hypothetical protein